ncbi:MAG: 5-formyltetrahydrofolate cyclo-ligase [Thermoleophilia bacterium]
MDESPDQSRSCENAEASKRTHRQRCLASRDALPPAEHARLSAAICARAMELPELQAAATLSVFADFRSEIDTDSLLTWALRLGKEIGMPRVLGPRRMVMLRVTDPAADLAAGSWGIPEPRPELAEVPPERFDALVIPGSVFDACGRRCGYGGGFYDSYLPLTRPGIPWVALAFECQLVDELPCEPHDLAMTAVVTEARVIRPA